MRKPAKNSGDSIQRRRPANHRARTHGTVRRSIDERHRPGRSRDPMTLYVKPFTGALRIRLLTLAPHVTPETLTPFRLMLLLIFTAIPQSLWIRKPAN